MERLAEQLEIVTRSWTEDAFSFQGRHYQVQDLRALPKPVQRPRPTLLVGGAAGPKSLALAARWADEYNTVGVPLEELRAAPAAGGGLAGGRPGPRDGPPVADDHLRGRPRPGRGRRAGGAGAGRHRQPRQRRRGGRRAAHWLLGTVDEVAERLRRLEAAGVRRVMCQHLDHADTEMVAVLGEVAASMDATP